MKIQVIYFDVQRLIFYLSDNLKPLFMLIKNIILYSLYILCRIVYRGRDVERGISTSENVPYASLDNRK